MRNNIEQFICTVLAVILLVFLVGGFLFVASFLSINLNKLLTSITQVKPTYETDKVICFEKYNVATNSSSLSCVNKETK